MTAILFLIAGLIAKVFCSDLSILILDEPTASLTEKESRRLFSLIEQAKNNKVGIIYITHRMGEIRRISDRIMILRDGKYIAATVKTDRVTDTELVEMMTGRVIDRIFPTSEYNPGKTVLSVEDVTTADRSARNISMEFKEGEIVGLAGLVGSGKSEIMRACFGIESIQDIRLFVFDEPTAGVDVGTRAAIYEFLRDLCQEGAAIALISSDLPEILHLTNRAYVFYRGHARAELSGDEITEQNVLFHHFLSNFVQPLTNFAFYQDAQNGSDYPIDCNH